MTLLLTILSVLAVWAFLSVLVLGLLLIIKPLESVRAFMEKITMGVRAIERQSDPLARHADALAASMDEASGTLRRAAIRLGDADRGLRTATLTGSAMNGGSDA
jgi:hypothetical protein